MEPLVKYAVPSDQSSLSAVDRQRFGLTTRESEVLSMVCEALPDKLIARRLEVSTKTVSCYLEHIYEKLGIRSQGDTVNARCAAILKAIECGLVQKT